MSSPKNLILLISASLMIHPGCKDKDEAPAPIPTSTPLKRYHVNQRFVVGLKERVEIADTTVTEVNPATGLPEHPIYTVRFDSVLSDDRTFGYRCNTVILGSVNTQVTMNKGAESVTRSFEYRTCYNLDYSTSPLRKHIKMGSLFLYMLKTHPVPVDSDFKKEDDTTYRLALILKK